MKYSVGQTLFLLSRKDRKVIPVRVVEEIVKKTIEDQVVSYGVQLPDKNQTVTSLSDLDVEIFVRISDLRNDMISRATSMIDELIDRSKAIAENKFGYAEDSRAFLATDPSVPETTGEAPPEPKEDFSNAEVDLGNGLKARISSSVI